MRRVYRKRSFSGYLLPFLILIGCGVIGVLSFQLWSNFQNKHGDVFFYIVSGKAQTRPAGVDNWENAYSGTTLLTGDSLQTLENGRLVLEFYNGTKVRLDENTQISLVDISKSSDSEKIALSLDHGKMWLNKVKSEGVQKSSLEVRSTHMLIKDTGTIFEVEKDASTESVRVMKGSVSADILANEENKDQVSDSKSVGVGQEVDIDEAILKAIRNHEDVTLLLAIRNDFKSSEWYEWNSAQDENPTDFTNVTKTNSTQSLVSPSTQQSSSGSSLTQQNDTVVSPSTNGSSQESLTDLDAPKILEPTSSEFTSDKDKMVISGTVEPETKKIVVEQTISGKTEEYVLSKFKPGSSKFTYNVSVALGNFATGINTYNFYAVDAKGQRSNAAKIIIHYDKKTTVITETLTAPTVSTFNGSSNSNVKTGTVKVEGKIQGAEKIVVNGYNLTQFVPGASSWVYYAKETSGNLKPGVNEYEVHGVDPNGKQTQHVKFTITYDKPVVPDATQQVPVPAATSTVEQTQQGGF